MKFFSRVTVKEGGHLPEAWLGFGKYDGGWLQGNYIIFHLPLYVLKWAYRADLHIHRFGWFVPSIRIMWGNELTQVVITCCLSFHSNFMGEFKAVSGYEVERVKNGKLLN